MAEAHLGQKTVCERFGARFVPVDGAEKVGLARDVTDGSYPINGLRHPPDSGTSGWFLWVGESGPAQDPAYFVPLHAEHLRERLPEVEPYLGLAPGWRFLLAPGHEDVWFDEQLLDVQGSVE